MVPVRRTKRERNTVKLTPSVSQTHPTDANLDFNKIMIDSSIIESTSTSTSTRKSSLKKPTIFGGIMKNVSFEIKDMPN